MDAALEEAILGRETDDPSNFQGYNRLGLGRHMLPINKHKIDILYSVQKYSCTIVIAETGSGKTTQIPQYLVEAGYALDNKSVAVTQPRRVAAISIAKRVAEEVQGTLGNEVGYQVRFEDRSNENTLIKFLTDGMLIKEMMRDPLLRKYSVVMVDDIHERSLHTDMVLGLLKKIRRKRPELKLIVSSATLDAEAIAKYFEEKEQNFFSNIVQVEGRMYPVDIHYLKKPCKNYVAKAVQIALMINKEKPEGDILLFLTGQEEIDVFISMIQEQQVGERNRKLFCCPLYANLPIESQMQVFDPAPRNTRKIVVSTNLAESSVTIDGIVYVIDCCFVKMKYYDFKRGFDSLNVVQVSKSSANQRAGRAGRVKPGECFRLTTKSAFDSLFENSPPEILRVQLSEFLLQLKTLGVSNVADFDFMDHPSEETLVRALELLFSLKIIDDKCDLTEEVGMKLSEFPLEPRLGVILLNSAKEEFSCSQEILILVSMLSVPNIFYAHLEPITVVKAKKRLGAKEGDHITLINIYIRYQHIRNKNDKRKFCNENGINEKALLTAQHVYEQLEKYLKRYGLTVKSSEDDVESIMRCIATGFFANVAQRQMDGSYKGIRSQEVLHLHPHSILTVTVPEWVMYGEIVRTGKYYMREVSELDYRWLLEIAPHFYEDSKGRIHKEKHIKEIQEQNKFEEIKKTKEQEKQPESVNFFLGAKKKKPLSSKLAHDKPSAESNEKAKPTSKAGALSFDIEEWEDA